MKGRVLAGGVGELEAHTPLGGGPCNVLENGLAAPQRGQRRVTGPGGSAPTDALRRAENVLSAQSRERACPR